mmetsp:Transcript_13221/g.32069  ORF Transcript_13221/g.32069 Transcript_13221/m.32069 type:complete len:218 (+) Transcript_13221:455-1108(+)
MPRSSSPLLLTGRKALSWHPLSNERPLLPPPTPWIGCVASILPTHRSTRCLSAGSASGCEAMSSRHVASIASAPSTPAERRTPSSSSSRAELVDANSPGTAELVAAVEWEVVAAVPEAGADVAVICVCRSLPPRSPPPLSNMATSASTIPSMAPTRRWHGLPGADARCHSALAAERLRRQGCSGRSDATSPASNGPQRETAATCVLIAAIFPTTAAT